MQTPIFKKMTRANFYFTQLNTTHMRAIITCRYWAQQNDLTLDGKLEKQVCAVNSFLQNALFLQHPNSYKKKTCLTLRRNHQQAYTSCRGQSNTSLNSYSQAKTTEKMKFQSILVFLVASLAVGTYAAPAQTCEIGRFNIKH